MDNSIVFIDDDGLRPDGIAGVKFFNDYSCPRCGALLEVGDSPTDCWLLCPECGRPSDPPEATSRLEKKRSSRDFDANRIDRGSPRRSFAQRFRELPYSAILGIALTSAFISSAISAWGFDADPAATLFAGIIPFVTIAVLFRRRPRDGS